jgi:hypothetical protein
LLFPLENPNNTNIRYQRIAIKTKSKKTINNCKGYVLKAELTSAKATSTYNDKQYPLFGVNFIQLLPIPVRTKSTYTLNASSFIYYSQSGSNPRYYNSAIKLQSLNSSQGFEPINNSYIKLRRGFDLESGATAIN